MNVFKIVVGQLDVNCYIVTGEKNEAIVIDPGDEADRIIEAVDQANLKPKYIVLTHAHYDHVCAIRELKDRYGASLVMHEAETASYKQTERLCMTWGYAAEDFPAPDILVKDGEGIGIDGASFKVIHTPGHTPGCMCLFGEGLLFTGDTLFQGSVGRTDLPGGNSEKLFSSLDKLVVLPPETKVFCGHGDETTIGDEVKHNPFLNRSNKLRFF